MLRAGEYADASEAMRDAVRALRRRRSEEALKLERLRLCIQAGAAALERGDYAGVEENDLDVFLDELAAR